uniref:Uncharacterized protein n=1 Tax=Plectus sambesii TaxID=2011161 RepID=A0A914XRM5_9BILA
MMNLLAYGIVVFHYLCYSVIADNSNVTSLMANCSSTGGCDFEFVIDQIAVEITGMDELRTTASNVTQTMPILRKSVTDLLSKVGDVSSDSVSIYSLGQFKYHSAIDSLKKMSASVDDAIEKSQSAAQAIMEAALCFQSPDSEKDCGAMVPDKLT